MDTLNLTLVRSRIKSRPYAKIDSVYAGPTWRNNIGLHTIEATSESLYKVMRTLSGMPDTCMVTGTAKHGEIIDTDRTLKNFKEDPIRWVTIDLDRYESNNMKRYGRDIEYGQAVEDVEEFIKYNLPPEFHNTSYILRFSSSFLLKDTTHLRVHIVFLLEESQYPREIGMWMRMDGIPCDATFYLNLTQPIFTAAPIWKDKIDPLLIKGAGFPRVSFIKHAKDSVSKGWQPYYVPERGEIDVTNLPKASQLPGKIGAFCRYVSINKVLVSLGYSDEGGGRFLSPTSGTGLPGVMVFDNGYAFSHHDNDPINQICDKVYKFKRRSLNAHDIMLGWAVINKDTDPGIYSEYTFMLEQAKAADTAYQDELQEELVSRLDWLTETEYANDNRRIIDSVMQDMQDSGVTEVTRDYIFNIINAKTGKAITKTVLKSVWQNMRKDQAMSKDTYDPDAGLRHMANIFARQGILYSHHRNLRGDYWCYVKKAMVWRRLNSTQTEAFIYDHIHEAMPIKVEIDIHKAEKLIKVIMRHACASPRYFNGGKGWAFKGGRYGIDMKNLFSGLPWHPDTSVRTLRKQDFIHKELPITYEEWLEAKLNRPKKFLDYMESSLDDDVEAIEQIREFGGYVFADAYPVHKFLILEGLPGSGKSILAKILQSAVGRNYYTASSIKTLGSQFGRADFPGKKLVIMSEARTVDFNELRAAVPILLKITGADYLDIEAKNKNFVTEALECKILLITNRTPVLPDDTGALAQRIMMIRMNKVFRGTKNEVLGLDDTIIREELPEVIRWFLLGLSTLSERRHFVEAESSKRAKMALLRQIDPLKTFIEEYFDIMPHSDPVNWISQPEFMRYFRAFMRRIGQTQKIEVIRKRASRRNIESLYPNFELKRMRAEDGGLQSWLLVGFVPVTELALEFSEELSDLE